MLLEINDLKFNKLKFNKNYKIISDSKDARQWGEIHYSKWLNNLSPKESIAIMWYSTNYANKINNYLEQKILPRNDFDIETINRTVHDLSNCLDRASTPENIVVYKGIKPSKITKILGLPENTSRTEIKKFLLSQNLHGSKFQESGFMSTTLISSVGDYFSASGSKEAISFVLKINAPKGAKGAYIQKQSSCSNEFEILFNKGQMLEIKNVKEFKMLQYNRIEIECDLLAYSR